MGDDVAGWHRLRPLEHSDVTEIASWLHSVGDLQMFAAGLALPPSVTELSRRWARAIDGEGERSAYFFVVDDPGGDPVAFAGIEAVDLVHGTAVTPLLVSGGARRRGLGVLTRSLVLDLALLRLGLHRVASFHRADNEPSRRLNAACGLRPEGVLRSAWRTAQGRVDVNVAGILATEWREHRSSLAQRLPGAPTLRCGDDPETEWPTAAMR